MSTLRSTRPHYSAGPRQSSIMITDDLIWEILVHLPAKSLMRFKCVSNHCYSIIRSLKFAIAHANANASATPACFRRLLILDIYRKSYFKSQMFSYVNLNDNSCRKLMQHQLNIQEEAYKHVTPVVKGLIGLYCDGEKKFTLCNIATHQFLKLPDSPGPAPDSYYEFYFSLGFDVVNQVFKVLSIYCCFDEEDNVTGEFTHVLTFGINSNSDMNWRKIDPPASIDLSFHQYQQCLCINGVLYWMPSEFHYQPMITAFHLNSETFETIAVPESASNRGAYLVEICGRPALVGIDATSDCIPMLDVWMMNDEAWTRKRVVSPTGFDTAAWLEYAATLPTGEMMLYYRKLDNLPLHIYIYDHVKNEFSSITVEGYKSQSNGMEFEEMMIFYYEENIINLALFLDEQSET